jgi:hypothetical protein
MAEIAIRVEKRAGKQTVPILEGDDLTAVQMTGQNQIVAVRESGLPDSRVVSAEDADVPIDRRRGVGAGDDDESLASHESRRLVVDPASAAAFDGLPDAICTYPFVVVAPDRQNECKFAEPADQITEAAQRGGAVHQVPAEQHCMRCASVHGIQHLPGQCFGPIGSEVDVADI